ncbi:MAG: hypothetical protein ACYCV8_07960, partial [bacterium]
PEEVEQNKYTPKPDNLDKWFRATGGINGEKMGLELDALPPDRIRSIFIDALKKHIDVNDYADFLKESHLKYALLNLIEKKISDLSEKIISSMKDIVQFDDLNILFDYAERGNSSYLPVETICHINSEQKNEIIRQVGKYFQES